MDNKEYWREHKKYRDKQAQKWAMCPICHTKNFYLPKQKCQECGYPQVEQEVSDDKR